MTSASAVSRKLAAAGFRPVGTESRREGIRVSGSGAGPDRQVRVAVDFDGPRAAARRSSEIEAVLATSFSIRRVSPTAFYVTAP